MPEFQNFLNISFTMVQKETRLLVQRGKYCSVLMLSLLFIFLVVFFFCRIQNMKVIDGVPEYRGVTVSSVY